MRKILVVEDEPVLRETYELILSSEPYNVQTAFHGSKALEMCKNTEYDLILLDLMMPVMDGVTFLEHYLKEIGGKDDLPKIIILSNLSSGEELSKALKLGASKNYVKADLSPKQLINMVRYELQTG